MCGRDYMTPHQTHNTQVKYMVQTVLRGVLYPEVHGNGIEKKKKKVDRRVEV
jgi:hypothetical protein